MAILSGAAADLGSGLAAISARLLIGLARNEDLIPPFLCR